MADPNNAEQMKQIHFSEREIEALENKIANADESNTHPAEFAAMRSQQEGHRRSIIKSKAEIDQGKWSESED